MQELQDFLRSLKKNNISSTCFIVEGKNDVVALKKLHLNNIQEIKGNLYLFCEKISQNFKQAIILTDIDGEGKKLYAKIKNYLTKQGVIIIDRPRELLFKIKLSHIEGLTKYIENNA